jgi:hypothetical protein
MKNEDGKKEKIMTEWIISGNPKKYNVVDAFHELGKVDWKQSTNVSEGDIVYIYVSDAIQAVRFKCIANKVDIKEPDIDDREFNISGEYDGTYGRYMELEMIDEFPETLFTRKTLESYGFSSPQGPVRLPAQLKTYIDLIQKLRNSNEMDPDKHDGSYELVKETIKAYSEMGDLSTCDYNDLNLVYLMTVGTWAHKVETKKKIVDSSNLPEVAKEKLKSLLDIIWKRAQGKEYTNSDGSFGMFGTGFFSFKEITDKDSSQKFIKACVDIFEMEDDEQIYDRFEKVLDKKFRGMKAASASMVLHCLKPFTFPIFNSNMGSDNIYVYLGVDLDKKTEAHTYISNCRQVKKYRDEKFSIKNYRIFDMAAWSLGKGHSQTEIDYIGVLDYLDNNRDIPYSNPEAPSIEEKEKQHLLDIKRKGQAAVSEMKKMFDICKKRFGLDKCEPMSWLDGSNTKTRKYLWAQMKYGQHSDNPISISIFVELSDVTSKTRYRISLETKNDSSDKNQMRKYHSFLDLPIDPRDSLVYVSGSNEFGAMKILNETVEVIKQKINKGEYYKVQLCRVQEWVDELTNDDCETVMLEAVEALIPYYEYVLGIENVTYWPSLEEYNPNISRQEWSKILLNEEICSKEDLKMLSYMLLEGGESTCTKLAIKYGSTASSYNMRGSNFGKKIIDAIEHVTPCPDGEENRYFPIPFVGRKVIEDGNKRYSWKLRDELKEALEEMDLSKIGFTSSEVQVIEYDKNLILYGPPGTGKTYYSAIYAVAICDNKSLNELTDYEYVMKRYNELKNEQRIVFTTFHQSYGYEEFIEGIKPVVSDEITDVSGDISYKVTPGIFKKFCETAKRSKVKIDKFDIPEDATVWKATIRKIVSEDCFKNNRVRIDFGIDSEGASAFVNDMKLGDIIITTDGSRSKINGISIISKNEAYLLDSEDDTTTRDVIWLATHIDKDIKNINKNRILHRRTVARVPGMQVGDIVALAKENNSDLSSMEIQKNEKPYVFVIDEINRGNISKIFGELITLIECTRREGMPEATEALLPYSGDPFSIPKNVYILGTMNTADRSIALMDTALRRRFSFIEMMPETDILRSIGADKVGDLNVADMLDKMNERISFLYDREHTIGHAFFTELKDDPSIVRLQRIFEKSVIPLLQEYFYEDYQKIQMVLGDDGKGNPDLKFIKDEKVVAKDIFKGNIEDVVDLPEKKFSINKKALSNLQSYIEIL